MGRVGRGSIVRMVVPLVVIAIIATSCSGGRGSSRGAAGSLGDPTTLAPLPAGPVVPDGTMRTPVFAGALITPDNGRSTSVAPTIRIPGAVGGVKFEVRDLSTGAGGFRRTYDAAGDSVRIPQGAGLRDGSVYTWTGTDSKGTVKGGSFIVDVTETGVQPTDTIGGITTGLASGAAMFDWSSHSMNSTAGQVGFGLVFDTANASRPGVPAGWNLQVASSSPYSRLVVAPDRSIAVESLDGSVTTYRPSTGGSFAPVPLPGELRVTGTAPVLTANPDGTYTVLDKQSNSVFSAPSAEGVADLVSVTGTDRAVLGQEWSDGRLRAIVDPVSGRRVRFEYGGGRCGSTSSGFVAAPAGLLCRVEFWDGSASAIRYVNLPDGSAQIGRIIDHPDAGAAGADVTDLAFDSIGRIATVRSPIVASVIAAGMIDAGSVEYLTSLVYDDEGRVASIAGPAAAVGATGDLRTYRHSGVQSTEVVSSKLGGVLSAVRFDPTSWRILSATDAAGLTQTYEYAPGTGDLVRQVDGNGNVTTRTYRDGRLAEMRGPTEGSMATDATVTRYGYDQTFADAPDGREIEGLDISYWSNAEWSGGVTRTETGPIVGGTVVPSLTVNWASSPIDSDAWSARMTGVVKVAREGTYAFASSNTTAKLWVDSVECSASACASLPMSAGIHDIRVDVASPTPSASMSLTWNGPDTGGSPASIPIAVIRPQYGLITTTRSVDQVATGTAPVDTVARTVYASPSTGQVAERRSQGGGVSTLSYEPDSGGSGRWGRQSAATMPSGSAISIEYWGDRESATAPCPGASSAPQGGLTRSSSSPGVDGAPGPIGRTWFDAAGRVVASRFGEGAVTCSKYDDAGRIIAVERTGMGRKEKVTTAYGVDGNPLVSETTITTGADVATTRIELDLAGRTVRTTDRYGVVTRTRYDDRTGKAVAVAVEAPGAVPILTTTEYSSDARIARVLVDGAPAADLTYGADGTVASIAYGNGTSAAFGYDSSNRASSIAWRTSDGRSIGSTREIAPGGRILSAGSSLDGATSRFEYAYDDSRHLASATLTAGLTDAHSWAFTYDVDGNRLSQVLDGRTSTYTYDAADRLVSSTDPALAGAVEYDDRGNTTRIGPDTFAYDASDALVSATDGTTTITFERDATGSVISRTIRDAAGESVRRIASGGVVLDGSDRAIAAQIALPGGVTIERSLVDQARTVWAYDDLSANRLWTSSPTGALVGTLQVYDPFGSPLTVAATPGPEGTPNLAWQATFGHETQPLRTPFIVMGSRVYLPSLGRFLQMDPKLGGSANAYDFVSQDPINLFDPTGRSVGDWIAMFVVSALSIAAAPFTGGGSVLAGMAVGLAIGAAGYLLEYGIATAIDGTTEFSVAQLCISAGLGAVFGAFGGGMAARRAAKSAESSVTSSASSAGVARTTAAVSDVKTTTFTVKDLTGSSRRMWEDHLMLAEKEVREASSTVAASAGARFDVRAMAQSGLDNATSRFERIGAADPETYQYIWESLIYPVR